MTLTPARRAAAVAKLRNLQSDVTKYYTPNPTQLACHESMCQYRLIAGSNRCLGGGQVIDGTGSTVRDLFACGQPFEVMAYDESSGEMKRAWSVAPFTKPSQDIYRVSFGDAVLECTLTHLVFCVDGLWRSFGQMLRADASCHLQSTEDIDLSASPSDVWRWMRTAASSLERYSLYLRQCGPLLRRPQGGAGAETSSPSYELRSIHFYEHLDAMEQTHDDNPCNTECHPSSQDVLSLSLAQSSSLGTSLDPCLSSFPLPSLECQASRLSPPLGCRTHAGSSPHESLPRSMGSVGSLLLPPVLDAITVTSLGKQVVYDFTVPVYHNYVAGGFINHNSGKSTSMAMEVKWAMEGSHPYRPNFIGGNYLLVTTRRQQADLVWRKKLLLQSELRGAPKKVGMIPEHKTEKIGLSTDQGIRALKSLVFTKEYGSSQLIVVWSGDQNSWQGLEGIQFDGVFIDENSVNEMMMAELSVRVRDAYDDPAKPGAGFIMWAATETKVNPAFTRFREVCRDENDPTTGYFEIPAEEAVAVTEESGLQAAKLMSDEVAKSRVNGIGGALDLVQIYPQFDKDLHCVRAVYEHQAFDNIVVGYDPGMSHPTGMVVCSIRRDDPETLHVWACFNRTRQTIDNECDWLFERLGGQYDAAGQIERFPRQIARVVYDPSAKAAQKAAGGQTIASVLHTALQDRRLMHKEALYRFAQNQHDIGIERVRSMLTQRKIVIYTENVGCSELVRQLIMYRGRPATNFVGVHGVVKKDDDLCDPIRYVCAEKVKWTNLGPNTYNDGEVLDDADRAAQKRVEFHIGRRRKRR